MAAVIADAETQRIITEADEAARNWRAVLNHDDYDSYVNTTASPSTLQIHVMDWITDTPMEQGKLLDTFRSHLDAAAAANNSAFQSNCYCCNALQFCGPQHCTNMHVLEIRMAGYIINRRQRLHVGMNTLPLMFQSLQLSNYDKQQKAFHKSYLYSSKNKKKKWVPFHIHIQSLVIDLECLCHEEAMNAFCQFISGTTGPTSSRSSAKEQDGLHHQSPVKASTTSIQHLTIVCSGERVLVHPLLQKLGQALQSLTANKLQIAGAHAHQLATLLQAMTVKSNSNCGCPRILPLWRHDPLYQPISTKSINRFPQKLHLCKVYLDNTAIANLISLLSTSHGIQRLLLKECRQNLEDLDFLQYLLDGHTAVTHITLDKYEVSSQRQHRPWWRIPGKRAPPVSSKQRRQQPHHRQKLQSLQLLDCKGPKMACWQPLTTQMVQNPSLKRLKLESSSLESLQSIYSTIHALHHSIVIRNSATNLVELEIRLATTTPNVTYRLQQIASLLSHPQCVLQTLKLEGFQCWTTAPTSPTTTSALDTTTTRMTGEDGRGAFVRRISPREYLDVLLMEGLLHNNGSLHSLQIVGRENVLDMATLTHLVSMLGQHAPQVKSLQLGFLGLHETDAPVIDIFRNNRTLENIQILPVVDDVETINHSETNRRSPEILFIGLRNRIWNLLLAWGAWTPGTWRFLLRRLLVWYEKQLHGSSGDSTTSGNRNTNGSGTRQHHRELEDVQRIELVYLSGLWYAFQECPMLVSELGPVIDFQRTQRANGVAKKGQPACYGSSG